MTMPPAVFIVGCGYVGLQVAQRLRAQAVAVQALARNIASQAWLAQAGITPVSGDLDQPDSLPRLALRGHSLAYFAPPPATGVQDTRLGAFLEKLEPDALPERVLLISTTGVYGDCQGAWIDETHPVNPQADRAKRRVDAECRLRTWAEAHQVATVILRVPGIYGPGRLPVVRLQQALPVLDAALSPYSNRIHVEDLVRACLAALSQDGDGEIYNVSDGHPSTMTDYFNQVADALGLPRPPVIDEHEVATALSEEMRAYLAESKRLDNRKMREALGIRPLYPDLASGLAQCVRAAAPVTR
jgi:nucleoside-diphosphate-sugar epimerase